MKIFLIALTLLLISFGFFVWFKNNAQPENCGVVGCYSKDYKGRTLLNGQPFGGAEYGWPE